MGKNPELELRPFDTRAQGFCLPSPTHVFSMWTGWWQLKLQAGEQVATHPASNTPGKLPINCSPSLAPRLVMGLCCSRGCWEMVAPECRVELRLWVPQSRDAREGWVWLFHETPGTGCKQPGHTLHKHFYFVRASLGATCFLLLDTGPWQSPKVFCQSSPGGLDWLLAAVTWEALSCSDSATAGRGLGIGTS